MAVTLEQVRNLLESDEPKYRTAAKLGAALLPHLQAIVSSPDEDTASKAAYLASLVNDPRAVQVMQAAAQHRSPLVRIAVAAAARNTRLPNASSVLAALTRDSDKGVRKAAGSSGQGAGRPTGTAVASIGRPGARSTAARPPRAGAPRRPGGGRATELEYEGESSGTRTYWVDGFWLAPHSTTWESLGRTNAYVGTRASAESHRMTLRLKGQAKVQQSGGQYLVRCFVRDHSNTQWLDCGVVI